MVVTLQGNVELSNENGAGYIHGPSGIDKKKFKNPLVSYASPDVIIENFLQQASKLKFKCLKFIFIFLNLYIIFEMFLFILFSCIDIFKTET
jgi:hypothetical protein